MVNKLVVLAEYNDIL